MSEFYADNIELWTFDFFDTKFHLVITNLHNQFWREFFLDLESGKRYDDSKKDLIDKIKNYRFNGFSQQSCIDNTEDVTMKAFAYQFVASNLKSNFEILENDSVFLSLIRQSKINRLID